MTNEPYGSKLWNFQDIIFVCKWMNWKVFAFALQYGHLKSLIPHFLQSLRYNLETLIPLAIFVPSKNLSPWSGLQLGWNDINVGEWDRYYCTKTEI